MTRFGDWLKSCLTTLLVVGLSALPRSANAQRSATIQVSALVVGPPAVLQPVLARAITRTTLETSRRFTASLIQQRATTSTTEYSGPLKLEVERTSHDQSEILRINFDFVGN